MDEYREDSHDILNYDESGEEFDFNDNKEEGELVDVDDNNDDIAAASQNNLNNNNISKCSVTLKNDPPYNGVDSVDGALGEFLNSTQPADNEDHLQQPDDDEFINNLAQLAAVEKSGPATSAPVAKLISNHISRDYDRNSSSKTSIGDITPTNLVIQKFAKYPVPANITGLMSCKVNDSVFKALNPTSKKFNGELHLAEAAVCKSLAAQTQAFEKLADLKSQLKDSPLREQFNTVFSLLADSVEFCSFNRAKVNETRRVHMLSSLNDNYKHLVTETKAENGLLFGNNLESAMKSVEQTNRLSRKLAPNTKLTGSKPFLGRGYPPQGRGRGRYRQTQQRYVPFHHQRQANMPYSSYLNRQGQEPNVNNSQLPPPKNLKG